MDKTDDILLHINPSYSASRIQNGRIIASINADFKIFECDEDILNLVLRNINGGITKKELISIFASEYGEDVVRSFIDALISEKVILLAEIKEISDSKNIKIQVVGNGDIYDRFLNQFFLDFDVNAHGSIEDFLSKDFISSDTVILILENDKFEDVLQFNSIMVKNNQPFFIIRSNGNGITLGPYVFPWKTPCLECHILHHLRALGLDTVKFTAKILSTNNFSYPLNKNVKYNFLLAYEKIKEELLKLRLDNQQFEFIRTEKNLYEKKNELVDIKIYQTICDCNCCHGMNQNFVYLKPGMIDFSESLGDLEESNIKYNVGGFRSKSEFETRNLLETAFDKIGCNIEIKLMEDNPFASVLPVFDSIIKPTHLNKTPYSFGEQISHGKGVNYNQAYFSVGFEIFERLSARYYGDRPIFRAKYRDVLDNAIDLPNLVSKIKNDNTSYDKFEEDKDIDWVIGSSLLTCKKKLLPASMTFLSSAVFRGKFFNDTSSGLASGATKIDAIFQGLLELVEHDAWLIGQCNNVELPTIDLNTLSDPILLEIINKIENLGYKIICRDYTNDIGIPVFRTWIYNPNNFTLYATSGFGASLCPKIALERSITEAVQSACNQPPDDVRQYESVNMRDLIYTRDSIYGLYYFQQKDIKIKENSVLRSLDYYENKTYHSVKDMLNEVIKRITKAIPDADILYYDLTRESIGIPVVRTLITGDIQRMSLPLIAVSDRLFNFQKKHGYSNINPSYDELYMGTYPH